jgi:DNA-binding response OmpR family regulator
MRRVLVVEDDRDIRDLVVEVLNDEPDLAAEGVDGGEGALRRLAAEGNVDLVLCDLAMPGCSGFELVARMSAHPATVGVPVVAMTALSASAVEADGRATACAAVVAKPFDLAELTAVLRAVLKRAPAPWRGPDRGRDRSFGP